MLTTNFTDFREHASLYLHKVEEGNDVIITKHGIPIAKIVPIKAAKKDYSWQKPGLKLEIKGVSFSKAISRTEKKGNENFF